MFVTPSRACGLKSLGGEGISYEKRHALAGVWIEIFIGFLPIVFISVTPSRACGLKSVVTWWGRQHSQSRPRGRVD